MLKIRCSELHHIIGTPKKAGESLTQTAKSHLINTFKQQQFGFTRFKGTGCTEKGAMLEETAIKASGMVRGKTYSKNTVRRENDFITGECDIHDPAASLNSDGRLLIEQDGQSLMLTAPQTKQLLAFTANWR